MYLVGETFLLGSLGMASADPLVTYMRTTHENTYDIEVQTGLAAKKRARGYVNV